MVSIRSLYASVSVYLSDLATLKHTTTPQSNLICNFCSSLTLNEIDKVNELVVFVNLPQSGQELTPFPVWMVYGEQVKCSTTKLRQSKDKNKNSEFWIDNNDYPLHLEGKPSSIYCFSIDWCNVICDGRNVWWNWHHFSENLILNMPHL